MIGAYGLRVYVAGPLMGSGNVDANIALACRVAQALHRAGFNPFVPHVNRQWTEHLPDGAGLAWDFTWLDLCDVLVRLPGVSPGSDAEVHRARARQMIVVNLDPQHADRCAGVTVADISCQGPIARAIWRAIEGVLVP